MFPNHVHVLIPQTYDYVTLHYKKGFADVTKLRAWRWEDYPRLSGCVQHNHKGSYKSEAGALEYEKRIEFQWSLETRRNKKMDSPLVPLCISFI